MCGISGFNWNDKNKIMEMNNTLKHRGPDYNSYFTNENISLGHTRLSIIDLSDRGNQPFVYKHGDRLVYIVFNGEIYNFLEIKKELNKKGYSFSSDTDTEVVLASYLENGYDCLTEFNGMWSFAIYDPGKNTIFCSRDRFGKKPFYYYYLANKFVFGSELKAIMKHSDIVPRDIESISPEAMELYFSLGFIPAPFTIFKNVKKLESGQNLVFNLDENKIKKKWHYYNFPEYNPIYDESELMEMGKDILRDAVRIRMIADVPVGAFLSGGIDSSSVVSEMSKETNIRNLNTFSIGFEDKWDESKYINIVKNYFSSRHHHSYFSELDYNNISKVYSSVYDEPFADYSGYPTYKVSEMAAKKVTVSLSGDGGDELFGGYTKYLNFQKVMILKKYPKTLRLFLYRLINLVKKNSDRSKMGKIREALRLSQLDFEEVLYRKYEDIYFLSDTVIDWYKDRLKRLPKSYPLAEAYLKFDLFFLTIPDLYLVKVDRASMAHSLEVRCPFLDHRLVEFSSRIPIELKYNSKKSKIFLKKLMKDMLPDEIINRKKQGFSPPILEWLDTSVDNIRDNKNFLRYLCKKKLISDILKNKIIESTNFNSDDDKYAMFKLFIFGDWFNAFIKPQRSNKINSMEVNIA